MDIYEELKQMRERLTALSRRLDHIIQRRRWEMVQQARKLGARLDGIEQDDTCIGCGRTELYCDCAQFDTERK